MKILQACLLDFHAPFPVGGREGRASALQMQGRLTMQHGGRRRCIA